MRTCKNVVEQITYQEDLSIVSKMMLKFHFFICKKCAKVDQQIRNLDRSILNYAQKLSDQDEKNVKEIIAKAKKNLSI